MTVVSDSAPLITLSKINHLHVLRLLFRTVYITPEVYDEVALSGEGMPGAAEAANADWIQIMAASEDPAVQLPDRAGLGAGEITTVLLAMQMKADVALMDDRKARALAWKNAVRPLGCIGILQGAFEAGVVPDLRNAYRLLLESGAYVDRRTLEANLRALNLPELYA